MTPHELTAFAYVGLAATLGGFWWLLGSDRFNRLFLNSLLRPMRGDEELVQGISAVYRKHWHPFASELRKWCLLFGAFILACAVDHGFHGASPFFAIFETAISGVTCVAFAWRFGVLMWAAFR